jgi:hypothetical protein
VCDKGVDVSVVYAGPVAACDGHPGRTLYGPSGAQTVLDTSSVRGYTVFPYHTSPNTPVRWSHGLGNHVVLCTIPLVERMEEMVLSSWIVLRRI